MKKLFLFAIALVLSSAIASAKCVVTIDGPEKEYVELRLENNTNQKGLTARLVYLKKQKDDYVVKGDYGTVPALGIDEIKSFKSTIKKGSIVGIELPKEMPSDIQCSIEYRDYVKGNVVVLHLYERGTDSHGFVSF